MSEATCPLCGAKMKTNKHGVYVCPKCGGAFVPKPTSIFGGRQE